MWKTLQTLMQTREQRSRQSSRAIDRSHQNGSWANDRSHQNGSWANDRSHQNGSWAIGRSHQNRSWAIRVGGRKSSWVRTALTRHTNKLTLRSPAMRAPSVGWPPPSKQQQQRQQEQWARASAQWRVKQTQAFEPKHCSRYTH